MGLSTPHGALGTGTETGSWRWLFHCLSTPHGALGTEFEDILREFKEVLSTPHGALGTS